MFLWGSAETLDDLQPPVEDKVLLDASPGRRAEYLWGVTATPKAGGLMRLWTGLRIKNFGLFD